MAERASTINICNINEVKTHIRYAFNDSANTIATASTTGKLSPSSKVYSTPEKVSAKQQRCDSDLTLKLCTDTTHAYRLTHTHRQAEGT